MSLSAMLMINSDSSIRINRTRFTDPQYYEQIPIWSESTAAAATTKIKWTKTYIDENHMSMAFSLALLPQRYVHVDDAAVFSVYRCFKRHSWNSASELLGLKFVWHVNRAAEPVTVDNSFFAQSADAKRTRVKPDRTHMLRVVRVRHEDHHVASRWYISHSVANKRHYPSVKQRP